MYDDIRSMLEWPAQVGSSKSIINNQGYSNFVRYVSNSTNIQHITTWIAYCFTIQRACAWCQSASIILRVSTIDKNGVDTPGAQSQVELSVGTAIQTAR